MGTVLPKTKFDLETQKPSSTRKFSSCSSYITRRSHLDSSSYRSLLRILSHCVNHSLATLSPAQERSLSANNPISSHERGEFNENQEADANTDGGTSAERQRCDLSAAGAELVGFDLSDFDDKEIEACVNSEDLHGVMLECGRLIEAPNEEVSLESHEGNGEALHEEIAHNENELEIVIGFVNCAEERVSNLGEVSEVAKGDVRVHNSLKKTRNTRSVALGVGNLVCSEAVEGTDCEKDILVETLDENSKEGEDKGDDKKQGAGVYSNSLVDYSGLKTLRDEQLRAFGLQMEEGEISDDAQDLEDIVDIKDNDEIPENRKKEGDDFNEVASTSFCVHKKEVSEIGDGLLDTSEENPRNKAKQNKLKGVEASERKKKSSTLTEERKAKKKIAKKRKRAQKNREQGVKKLKLPAIVKPKKLKYCNFYRMGRCQQGELCKFSHDTTPLTKSMPCKYFACNSCLRGDDCPYDHELSKYPCLNYLSTGSCIRGDRCKFSHKIPTTDASSQLTVGKIDLHSTSGQPMLRNQSGGTYASPLAIHSSEDKTKALPAWHKPLKEANRVPKGIHFISFGTVQTDLRNKVKESLPVNKSCHTGAYDNQKPDDLLVHSHQSALTLSWNSVPPKKSIESSEFLDASSNGFVVKDSGNVTKGSTVTHPRGTANHEVSEAAKILEEFLFCGDG